MIIDFTPFIYYHALKGIKPFTDIIGTDYRYIHNIPASFPLGILAVTVGGSLGNKTQAVVKIDLSWISGVMLIGLAIMKLK